MAVRYERLESTAVITLDRPGSLNAMNEALTRELTEAWHRFLAEEDALIAVLTGAGRAFCAGLDMKEAAEALRLGRPMIMTPLLKAADISKPAIAAINGPCAGGGIEMMLACDIAVCSDTAQFVLPFVARGRDGSSVALSVARRTSVSVALYMAMTASRIDAAAALRFNLVHEVLPQEEVLPRALEIAEKLAGYSQPALRNMKARLVRASLTTLEGEPGSDLQSELARSPDMLEGTLAFDEKRRPRYQ
ncbi:MAG TPA: enoyl-CoA hydratase/isomerase family protein [Dehalococcoidia bacterium]|nr:enoyl-CoA hydratase/isomerase family protein [Dehalococcoidia bacterium]